MVTTSSPFLKREKILEFFKKIFNQSEKCLSKTLEFPRVILQDKNIPCDFLIDEIDVDFNFFHNFLDAYVVQNRVHRLSKGLFLVNLPNQIVYF